MPDEPSRANTMALPGAVRAILRPPEDLSVSEWCDRHRYLSAKHGAEPGRWNTARTPYLKEPLDALADPTVGELIFSKCARIGGSEWTINLIGYTIDARPVPIMYAQPEKGLVEHELRGRLRALFEDSPRLRAHVPPGEWGTGTKLRLATADVHGAWAENPRTMIAKTIGLALFDEIDNCEMAAGGLGNTLDVLRERLVTYGYRGKLLATGTPTTDHASGWQLLQSSDFRRPHVPCPHCGHYQVLAFERIKLMAGHEAERDPETIELDQLAGYCCERCGCLIDHGAFHRWMIDRVVWIPKRQRPAEPLPLDDPEAVDRAVACGPPGHIPWTPALRGKPPRTRSRGYWINALYSPWDSRTWSHILAHFFRVKDDPQRLRVFTNSWLGEPWADAVEASTAEQLAAKRDSSYPARTVPPGVKVLLVGADVQIDHVHYVVRGWGVWESSWLIDEGTVETFDQLYELAFYTGFPVLGNEGMAGGTPTATETPTAAGEPSGGLMRATHLAIDTGYRQDEVLEFARRPGVVPVRGSPQPAADFKTRPVKTERFPRGGAKPDSVVVQHVNTHLFKSKVHRLAKLPEDRPGAWRLHAETSDDYCRQFTAEHQVWHRPRKGTKGAAKPVLVWEPKTEGAPNHKLDCEVYGAALADLVGVALLREHSPPVGLMDAAELELARERLAAEYEPITARGVSPPTAAPSPAKPRPKKRKPRSKGRGGGFFG